MVVVVVRDGGWGVGGGVSYRILPNGLWEFAGEARRHQQILHFSPPRKTTQGLDPQCDMCVCCGGRSGGRRCSLTLKWKKAELETTLGSPRLQYWPDSCEPADPHAIVLSRLDLPGLDGAVG